MSRALALIDGELSKVRRTAAKMIVEAIRKRPHHYIKRARDLDSGEIGVHLAMVLELLSEYVLHARAPDAVRHVDASAVWESLGSEQDPVELAPIVEEFTQRLERNVSERRQLAALLSRVWRWSRG